MSTSYTQSTTKTFGQQVVRVTRDARVDLLWVASAYPHQLSESEALKYINDFRVLMDEEVLKQIEYTWMLSGTDTVVDALRYTVRGGSATSSDRPGGLKYDAVAAKATFQVLVWRDWDAFNGLPEATKQDINRRLQISWASVGAKDYSRGRWSTDRNYVQPDVSLERQRFTRNS